MSDDSTGLEEELRGNGIDVESIERDVGVHLTYTTAFPGEAVHHHEMGRACRTFLELAQEGTWDPVPVEATVERSPGDVQGRWHLDPAWIRGWVEYRLSDEEFSERVVESLDEPAVDESVGAASAGGDASSEADDSSDDASDGTEARTDGGAPRSASDGAFRSHGARMTHPEGTARGTGETR